MATRSKYKEMAEAEAARAEADPDDADEDTDTDAEPETPDDETAADPDAEPADEPEALSAEAFAAKLESVLTVHGDNMRGLFGDEYDAMQACGVCGGLGAVSPDAPVLDPDTQRCEKCKGWGVLITEAQDQNHVQRQCPQCMGNGYVPRPPAYVPPPEQPQIVMPGYQQPQPQQMQTPQNPAPPIPPMPIYDAEANVWRDPQTNQVIGNGAVPAPQPAAAA